MKKFIVILSIFGLSSCGGAVESINSIEFEDVSMSFFKSFPVGGYEIFDDNSLNSIWDLGVFNLYPVGMVLQAQPIPVVDFTKYEIHGMVWSDNYWCYRPKVNNIILNNKILKIYYSRPTISTSACLRIGPAQVFLKTEKNDVQHTVWVEE